MSQIYKIDYFQEMDTIVKLQNRLECKINYTLPALLPNKLNTTDQGLVRIYGTKEQYPL